MSYCNECQNHDECDSGCWKGEALSVANRWKEIYTGDSHGVIAKQAGILARAFLRTRGDPQSQIEALALLRELNDALAISKGLQARVDAVLDKADAK